MCVAQGNIAGRLMGKDLFAKADPLMAAGERFDAKNVAPVWKQMANPQIEQPKALSYQEAKDPNVAGAQTTRRPRTNYANNTVLTGPSLSGAVTGGTTLLGA